jgi:hypothetical protein
MDVPQIPYGGPAWKGPGGPRQAEIINLNVGRPAWKGTRVNAHDNLDVGGPAWKGPGLKTEPGILSGTILT